jgi:hypothetical protein
MLQFGTNCLQPTLGRFTTKIFIRKEVGLSPLVHYNLSVPKFIELFRKNGKTQGTQVKD